MEAYIYRNKRTRGSVTSDVEAVVQLYAVNTEGEERGEPLEYMSTPSHFKWH